MWKAGLQLNLTKSMFMRNGQTSDAPFSLEKVVKRTKNIRLRAHLFDSTVLPAPTSPQRPGPLQSRMHMRSALGSGGSGRTMLGVTRFTQMREGLWSSELRRRLRIRDAVAWVKSSRNRWTGGVMRFADIHWKRAFTNYD
ncbi:unnamed protein product [Heligmosomoides polygyrus]|uniref:Reverse transcriptase domain-containing protein n=1 Tax=Heligmosomoides polygyrus TaxID=6339 RepID=A0A183GRS1_HELPZ|nr:unnamed protein product [Heligmosomoides polygyrus]